MGEILLYTILTLCTLGVVAAVILYFVAQKFKVYEDPRIDTVEGMLPAANCGGCGYPGCRGFADSLVREEDISSLYCPVGGSDTMKAVAEFLGKAAPEKEPTIAEVRCGGSCDLRPQTNIYDGAPSCMVAHSLYIGETGCSYGCLGKGDCVVVCAFDAIHMNPQTGLPEVDEAKCTACAACVKACPRSIIELRKQGVKNRRVYVNCVNKDKGAISRKVCSVSCIACSKCQKICPFEAITIENNLAYIDPYKCKLCRKCVPECPTNAICEVNFPPRKEPAAEGKAAPCAEGAPLREKAPAKGTKKTDPASKRSAADKTTEPHLEKVAASQHNADPLAITDAGNTSHQVPEIAPESTEASRLKQDGPSDISVPDTDPIQEGSPELQREDGSNASGSDKDTTGTADDPAMKRETTHSIK